MPEDELVKFAKVNFFQLAKRNSSPKTRIRLLALGHLQIGKKKKEIIEMFQITLITEDAPNLVETTFYKSGPVAKIGNNHNQRSH